LFEQTTESFHPFRGSDRFERDIGFDHFVHRDRMEIDMENVAADRGMLHFLDEREPARLFTFDLQLDENVLARGMAEHERNVALRNLQSFWFVLPAINDGRDCPLCLDFADR